jgi:hypothetical protein
MRDETNVDHMEFDSNDETLGRGFLLKVVSSTEGSVWSGSSAVESIMGPGDIANDGFVALYTERMNTCK